MIFIHMFLLTYEMFYLLSLYSKVFRPILLGTSGWCLLITSIKNPFTYLPWLFYLDIGTSLYLLYTRYKPSNIPSELKQRISTIDEENMQLGITIQTEQTFVFEPYSTTNISNELESYPISCSSSTTEDTFIYHEDALDSSFSQEINKND